VSFPVLSQIKPQAPALSHLIITQHTKKQQEFLFFRVLYILSDLLALVLHFHLF
jgi:hypothetical protein